MKVSKKTAPYSIEACTWDEESETWQFSWGEEISADWVAFSIKHQFPVESINEAYLRDPSYFALDEAVMTEILEDA